MRLRAFVIALAALALCAVAVICLFRRGLSSQGQAGSVDAGRQANANAAQTEKAKGFEAELTERLKAIRERAGGSAGVAVTHVETGRTVAVEGDKSLPLYSVFKLPLAVTVLKDVEDKRLRLDQKIKVTPAEVVPGFRGNTDLWRTPVERSLSELIEMSVMLSDNTSSDKLLQLVGGPRAVTERMRSLGLQGIDIRYTVREFTSEGGRPNTGTAQDLVRLLAKLQKGEVLQEPQLSLLTGFMRRSTVGKKRLRGDLPPGTIVADKTGTGDMGAATNDVGLITLPNGKGHLAMAVFISDSRLTAEVQEKLIAEMARAAFDAFSSGL
jgi:beta-lactamase class A